MKKINFDLVDLMIIIGGIISIFSVVGFGYMLIIILKHLKIIL